MSCYIRRLCFNKTTRRIYLFMKSADEHVCNVLYGFCVFLSTAGVED